MKPKWKILYPRFENENLYLREDLEDDASVSTLMGFCLKTHISMPLGLACLKHAHRVQLKSQRAY